MKTATKTGFATILLLAISCKKENNSIQPSLIPGKNSVQYLIADNNDPGMYPVIKIGTQKWMGRNLNVGRYRNGDKIPYVKGKAAWAALTSGAWCWYKNDSANGPVYGKLYNWYAVKDPRGLAPLGWHIPSYEEWDTLNVYLGQRCGRWQTERYRYA